jgi:hypothetical protein
LEEEGEEEEEEEEKEGRKNGSSAYLQAGRQAGRQGQLVPYTNAVLAGPPSACAIHTYRRRRWRPRP